MRGKQRITRPHHRHHRIIPAHAGQTEVLPVGHQTPPDHPRTCGANARVGDDEQVRDGSSPHMRGKLVVFDGDVARVRIIPAHAGQTPGPHTRAILGTDHPRTCGANPFPTSVSPTPPGSSPHMRGKPPAIGLLLWTLRIIPAHAGQTDGG